MSLSFARHTYTCISRLMIRVWPASLSKEVAQQDVACRDSGQPIATAPVFRCRSAASRWWSKPTIMRRKPRRSSSRVGQEIRTSCSPSSVQGAREVAGECILRWWWRPSRRWSRRRSPSCRGPAGRCGRLHKRMHAASTHMLLTLHSSVHAHTTIRVRPRIRLLGVVQATFNRVSFSQNSERVLNRVLTRCLTRMVGGKVVGGTPCYFPSAD